MGRSSKWKQPFLVQTVTSICLLSVCISSGRLHKTSQSNSDCRKWTFQPKQLDLIALQLKENMGNVCRSFSISMLIWQWAWKVVPGTRTRLQCTSPRKYAWINAACTQSPWPRHCPCRWKEGFSYQKCVVLTPFHKKRVNEITWVAVSYLPVVRHKVRKTTW